MKEQFQIYSLNRELSAYSQVLFSTTADKKNGVVEVVVLQLYYCLFSVLFSG